MPASFFDTDILLALASADTAKADKAEKLAAAGGTISVQVLNEIATVARQNLHLSWEETTEFLSMIRAIFKVPPVTTATHEAALALAQRLNLPIHDATIIAAALEANCETLWSEHMPHNLLIENRLRIANPFLNET